MDATTTQAGLFGAPPKPMSPRERAIAWAIGVTNDPTVAFCDTETTGLGPEAEIIDFGLVAFDGRVLIETLVKPHRPIPPEATAVHGITNEMVSAEHVPTWRVLYGLIARLLDGHRLIIYNAQFDLKLMNQCIAADAIEPWAPLEADCAMLRYGEFDGTPGKYPGQYKWHKLEQACARFGIQPGGHRALADADATRLLVHAMATAGRACRVCGCTDDDCRRCVEAQGHPCWWVEPDLCSRCAAPAEQLPETPVQVADRLWQRAFGRPPR